MYSLVMLVRFYSFAEFPEGGRKVRYSTPIVLNVSRIPS